MPIEDLNDVVDQLIQLKDKLPVIRKYDCTIAIKKYSFR